MTTFLSSVGTTTLVLFAGSALLAFLLALVATPFVGMIARRSGLMDVPGGRRNHPAPIPRIGGLAIAYLVGRLIMLLWKVQPADPAKALAAPMPTPEGHEWGTVKAVGTDLFNGGLFPFEAISILLLLAVVGAIAIARPLHEGQDNEGEPLVPGQAPATPACC